MTKDTVPWKNIFIYSLLAFALFWIPFFGLTLTSRGGNASGVWAVLFGILGPFSPLIAALLMRMVIAREGFGDAHLGIRKVCWQFWLLALILPFFWNSIQDGLLVVFGFASIDWSQVPFGLYRIPINLLGGLIIFIGEEFGWRSYLLEKMRPLGEWKALLISGTIWSLWHLPTVSIHNQSTAYGQQMSIPGTVLTLLIFVLLGFIFGWLYLKSNSVWPGVLMHSYNNLISLKLFSEAWSEINAPTLFQNALIAVGPILLIWLIFYWRGNFQVENL